MGKLIMLGLVPVLLAWSGPASAQSAGWRISEVSGDVRLVENGRARAATRGMLLSSGATIATGPAARAVIGRDDEYVIL